MAVQAQRPSNMWLADYRNRNGQEKEELIGGVPNSVHTFGDHNFMNPLVTVPGASSPMAFLQQQEIRQYQNQQQEQDNPLMINLDDLRLPVSAHSPVSTGLRLSLEGKESQTKVSGSSTNVSFIGDDLSLLFNQHQQEINHFIKTQSDRLRHSLIIKRQKQCAALVSAAERVASRKLREKELEWERVARRATELEESVERLRAETRFWQAAAKAHGSAAAALRERLVSEKRPIRLGENEPDDVGSVIAEPVRHTGPLGPCRACNGKEDASVVLLPCRHLCVCSLCAVTVTHCPLCQTLRTACIQASLS